MTPADWLVAILMLLACVLLFIGLAQALDSPARGHHRSRRSRGGPGPRRPAATAEVSPATAGAGPAWPAGEGAAQAAGSGAALLPSPESAATGGAPAAEPTPVNAVEACQALYREGRHAEVLRRVASHVSVAQGAEPYETALLWTLAALAHEAIGEPDEARAACDAAAWIMPDARAPVPAWLGDAGGALLRWLAAPVRTGREASEPSGARLHLSLSWLRALGAIGTEGARGAIAEVGEGLWAESARHANALLSQQEFQAVRDLAQEALACDALPPGRQEEFRELASMGLAAEIGRLMSRALERLDSPDEALAALDRGEAALRSVPADLVENRQRHELERRLWWGYTRLGLQRLDAGVPEEAVALFFRGLPLAEPDPERCSETRQALGRALEAWAARVREVAARELAEGNRDAATGEVRRLREALQRGVELGLLEADAARAMMASHGLRELGEEG